MPARSEKFVARRTAAPFPLGRARKPVSRELFTITVAGRQIRLGERTLLCGIVNVTPDSFWDGGSYLAPDSAIRHALDLAEAGADWVDVGGESTRPGAVPVSAQEELRRILPVIKGIHKRAPRLPISVDTTKSAVAARAVAAGATIINDISGLRFDPGLAAVARHAQAPLVLMHLRGRPATMQQRPFARSIARSLSRGLRWSINRALSLGVSRSQLIIDPGLGFGKTRRQNFQIMADIFGLRRIGLPILAGASHKSFIQAVAAGEALGTVTNRGQRWKLTKKNALSAEPALDLADAAAATSLALSGVHILRVHNVAAMLPAIRIADAMLAAAR